MTTKVSQFSLTLVNTPRMKTTLKYLEHTTSSLRKNEKENKLSERIGCDMRCFTLKRLVLSFTVLV